MYQDATILVVDDNEDGRRILQSLLKLQGYTVALAANGFEALEKATEIVPDLILLDVMMPGMDGFEVCRRLRDDPDLAEVPIVIVTALNDRAAKLQGIKAGADDFIVKPFDSVALTARVRSITRLNRYRRLLLERTKFNWVVKQADDGYIELNDLGHIIYANVQARQLLDLPAEEDESLTPHLAFLDVAQAQYNCEPDTLWKNWPNQDTSREPAYLVRPESEQSEALWLQVDMIKSISSLGSQYLVRLRDVTSKIHSRRNQWTFHAQISHKLTTPLSLMNGFLNLLQDTLDMSLLSEMQQEILEMVFSNAHRLQTDVVDILDYMDSRNMMGVGERSTPFARISTFLDYICQSLNISSLSIIQENIPDKPFNLAINAKAFELISWELMENAQRFHPEHTPAIIVELTMVTLKNRPMLRIRAMDDGIHIPPEQLSLIWRPYYQGEKHFTGEQKGMGLGLAMIASFIWEIGGRYKLYNRDDVPGVVVDLHIPILSEA